MGLPRSNPQKEKKRGKEKDTKTRPPYRGDAFRMSRDKGGLLSLGVLHPRPMKLCSLQSRKVRLAHKGYHFCLPRVVTDTSKNKTPGHDLPPLRDNHRLRKVKKDVPLSTSIPLTRRSPGNASLATSMQTQQNLRLHSSPFKTRWYSGRWVIESSHCAKRTTTDMSFAEAALVSSV